MAKPNYQFQKRQKELERKKKQEEKIQRKRESGTGQPAEDESAAPEETSP